MPAEALLERVSLAGGEIGRALRWRSDLAVYAIGGEVQENYVTLVEGVVTRRPGTRFVLELPNQSQKGLLLPFRVSGSDYYMVVINGGLARFVRQGGFILGPGSNPYQIVVPWSAADLGNVRPATRGNIMYVACAGKAMQQLTRVGHASWTVTPFVPDAGPVDGQNLDPNKTVKAGGATGTVALAGAGRPFTLGMLGQVMRLDDGNLAATPQWSPNEPNLAAGMTRRYDGRVYLYAGGGQSSGTNPPRHEDGDVSSGQGFATWRYMHSGYGLVRFLSISNDLDGATVLVMSMLPQSVVDAGTYRWYPPAWTTENGYPTHVAWSAPRLVTARFDELWCSGVVNPNDFGLTDDPDNTDAAFSIRIMPPQGDQQVDVVWLLSSIVLIAGTSDVEFQIRGPGIFDKITLRDVQPVPDGTEGSAPQLPALVDGGVMFIGKSRQRLHYAKIDKDDQGSQRLGFEELSVHARHIFASGATRVSWQRDPHRIAWITLGNGELAGLTYMPKQQIKAFHRHPMTNGVVEDVAVIPSTSTGFDEVYFIVRRTINGATKRYVEQLQDFFQPADPENPTAAGAWYLDCALRLVSVPGVTSVTGLGHLEGQQVGVFADGAMQTRKTVVNGAIALDKKSFNVLVGLPIVARLKDLPRVPQAQDGSQAGKQQTISEGVINLLHAGGGEIRVSTPGDQEDTDGEFEDLIEAGGQAPGARPLFSGIKRIPIDGELGPAAVLELLNDDAMPSTVTGFSPRARLEED